MTLNYKDEDFEKFIDIFDIEDHESKHDLFSN